jgi:anti-repressor protein
MQPSNQLAPRRMSSREVAELTGKNHAHVMRDIREMCGALEESKTGFVCETTSYTGGDGRQYPQYEMDKDTTICLLTGYDVVARMKVVKRWQQLEGATLLPQTKAEALRQLADSVEREEALALQLAEAQPAVDFWQAVASSEDAIPVTDAAKVLGIPGLGQNKLFEFLRGKNILMTSQGHWNMPYQDFINRGYFKVIEQKYEDREGKVRINTKTLVMQKGLDYIRRALSTSL